MKRSQLIITNEEEQILKDNFMLISTIYNKVAPPHRKNFLSYSFLINKLAIKNNLVNIINKLPQLNNKDKLHEQNKIWNVICEELKWNVCVNKNVECNDVMDNVINMIQKLKL
jgi:hypothetical protein